MLNIGDNAPDFQLQDQDGKTITLSGLRGKNVVLYFYPKADTPGCTVEAIAFRDTLAQFEAVGAAILGVSPDPVTAQQSFADKFDLPFQLLADTDHAVADAYGVWVEKKNYGKTYWGVQRATFVIDPNGKLLQVFPKVKVEGHADEVLGALRESPAQA